MTSPASARSHARCNSAGHRTLYSATAPSSPPTGTGTAAAIRRAYEARRRSAQRHAVQQQDRLRAGIDPGQPGIRGVIHGDTEPAHIFEAPGKLGAGAKLPPRAEIDARTVREIAAGHIRRQHQVGAEIDIDPEPAIAVERPVAGNPWGGG